uniref:Protein HIRA-like C-terminal domain-containing protein n=1 Tax=Biomphalaria glabrata TaxID=6526 RepID=A0A2C9LTD8_BIOGL
PVKPDQSEPLDEKSQQLPTTPLQAPSAEKSKQAGQDSGKDVALVKDKLKTHLTGGSLSLKRKLTEDKRSAKRGRPSKSDQAAREAAMAAAVKEALSSMNNIARTETPSAAGATGALTMSQLRETKVVSSVPDLQLPALSISSTTSKTIQGQMGDALSIVLEVENGNDSGGIHRLRCLQGGQVVWDHMLMSKICAVAGSSQTLCAACQDGTLSVFSKKGRRLLPCLVLGSPPTFLSCNGHYIMVVTTKGLLFVWNCQTLKAEIKEVSLTAVMS